MTAKNSPQPGFVEPQIKTHPRCSVVLCTYNRRNAVLNALASLRRQTLPYEQFEVIVIDNDSRDGTFAAVNAYISAGPLMAAKDSRDAWNVQCLTETQNGLAYARNRGIQVAQGEILVFLDDDVLAHPTFLERLLSSYDETGADAISGRVELRWEATRPHWLSDDLLDILGYFAPAQERVQLPPTTDMSSCSFSLKHTMLDSIGGFSPLLSRRLSTPVSMDITDICRRIRVAGGTLWYEPEAIVEHRVPAARLTRPYFVGRAYWQGRSEIVAQFADTHQHQTVVPQNLPSLLRSTVPEAQDVARTALVDRLLLFLARKPSSEQLLAAMAQARSWGHLQQHLQLVEHAPTELTTPSVFLVLPTHTDIPAELLARGLQAQHVRCTTSVMDIPLSWLWRHRAYAGLSIGILHFYRPGAFALTTGQHQHFWFVLWLAKRWGIKIVTTDTGGWWQSTRGLAALPHRVFERTLLRSSDIILAFTRQPDALYPDKRLRRRVRSLTHPGFRNAYPPAPSATEAQVQLGLFQQAGYAYLCFASQHSERELLALLDAFEVIQKDIKRVTLLLVGTSPDAHKTLQRRIANNRAIFLFAKEPEPSDISIYMGATNAVVLPHSTQHTAGMLETAMLALSFERRIIVPDLPRFRGMLPPRATEVYNPSNRGSLVEAMQKVQSSEFRLKAKDKKTLEAESSWNTYAQRLVEIYKQALQS